MLKYELNLEGMKGEETIWTRIRSRIKYFICAIAWNEKILLEQMAPIVNGSKESWTECKQIVQDSNFRLQSLGYISYK